MHVRSPGSGFSLGRPGGWGSEKALRALNLLLDILVSDAQLGVDVNRVYLTGLSMGGFGTWAWAVHSPHRFAAVAPVCGGWSSSGAIKEQDAAIDRLVNRASSNLLPLPHWVVHGVNDQIVPVSKSDTMVAALQAALEKVRAGLGEDKNVLVYKRIENCPAPFQPTDWSERRADGTEGAPLAPSDLTGHDSWTLTYTDANFFNWLLSHRKVQDEGEGSL